MELLSYSWVLPLIPLAVFAIVLATGRKLSESTVFGLGIGAMSLVFAGSLAVLWSTAQHQSFEMTFEWMRIGERVFELGIQVDSLTAVMLIVVSFVSLLVQIYSMGYMHGDERIRWFYAAIGLFSAAMLGVVLANNWLMMYMCWEVMGLASYLLIGFWYTTPEAPPAAMKAFLVTRAGDVGFGLALVIMWVNIGSFGFSEVFEAVSSGSVAPATIAAIALLLFAGAMGKSAQFPLHVWLPDAMAGPTPGSALIHAATMVAAGVYLVARSFPLFEAVPWTLTVVGTIGTITAVMGALIALAMNDIKKVLAYSTISQLGYMFLALGTGNWVAAIFHLMTHAFFKALLFMAAGSVIHATETQDLHELGGLAKKMPWTTATWIAGALSLAGIPPLAGFWSKDEILLSAFNAGDWWFLGFGLLTALLTAFYMGRATLLAFFVEPGPASHSSHAHESPRVMTGPLAALAVLAVTAGLIGSPLSHHAFATFLDGHEVAEPNWALAGVAVAVAVIGIGIAYLSYIKKVIKPDGYFRFPLVKGPLANKFWIDEIYSGLVLKPLMFISGLFRKADFAFVDGIVRGFGWLGMKSSALLAVFDRDGIDAKVVDGIGDSVVSAGEVRRVHTGNVQTYLLLFSAAVVIGALLVVVLG